MQVAATERSFNYNGASLPDPGPALGIEEVRRHYAQTYPELANAAIEGPEPVGDKLVYTFKRAVGTKG